jgi:hypothetical protein
MDVRKVMQPILGQLVVKLTLWSTKEVNQLQFTELYIILVTLVVETEVQQLLLMLHQHFIFIKQFESCICKIYVDDVLFHTVANTASLPFNKDFFLILTLQWEEHLVVLSICVHSIINGD